MDNYSSNNRLIPPTSCVKDTVSGAEISARGLGPRGACVRRPHPLISALSRIPPRCSLNAEQEVAGLPDPHPASTCLGRYHCHFPAFLAGSQSHVTHLCHGPMAPSPRFSTSHRAPEAPGVCPSALTAAPEGSGQPVSYLAFYTCYHLLSCPRPSQHLQCLQTAPRTLKGEPAIVSRRRNRPGTLQSTPLAAYHAQTTYILRGTAPAFP